MTYGEGTTAWTAKEASYFQHLTINLVARKELRGIATRGRYATEEYVSEYMIQYSDDGESWREVASTDGYVQVKGCMINDFKKFRLWSPW